MQMLFEKLSGANYLDTAGLHVTGLILKSGLSFPSKFYPSSLFLDWSNSFDSWLGLVIILADEIWSDIQALKNRVQENGSQGDALKTFLIGTICFLVPCLFLTKMRYISSKSYKNLRSCNFMKKKIQKGLGDPSCKKNMFSRFVHFLYQRIGLDWLIPKLYEISLFNNQKLIY